MGNPFTLAFGRRPLENIDRPVQMNEIIDAFLETPINQQIFMITGIRGSGKTVLMTDVSRHLKAENDWTVIELNPETDMLHSFAAKLSRVEKFSETFRKAKINLSLLGLGLEIDGVSPIADDETAISRMLESICKKGARVLVTVDEVTNNENIRKFAAAFQIFIRAELPVFLLMTGLFENIDDLRNQKSLTFLYRAPRIQLEPLNMPAMASRYKEIFHMKEEDADQMAQKTNGYAFAFQVLGYLTFRSGNGQFKEILPVYRQYLDEYVYEKLWSELSEMDKTVARGIAESKSGCSADIRQILGISSNSLSQYRRRLIKKGLVSGEEHGKLQFTLPLFDEYVKDQFKHTPLVVLSEMKPVNLEKEDSFDIIGLGWDTPVYEGRIDFDIDAEAFLLGKDGKVLSDNDFVFYGNQEDSSGSVRTVGDNICGDSFEKNFDEAIYIDFSRVPEYVEKIVISLSIYDAENRKQDFSQLSGIFVSISRTACSGVKVAKEAERFELRKQLSGATAIIACEIVRDNNDWKAAPIDAGVRGGLKELCILFGVNV